jgi:hypothetical protein
MTTPFLKMMGATSSVAEKAPHPAEEQTSKCHLLTIPPEVRDSILKYLLVSPEPLMYSSTVKNLLGSPFFKLASDILHAVSPGGKYTHTPLAIAGACKLLSLEAVPIYYGKNAFTFGDMRCREKPRLSQLPGFKTKRLIQMFAVYRFLKHSGQDRRSCIKDITFRLKPCNIGAGHTPRLAMRLLGQCGPLNKLTVNVNWECPWHNLFEAAGVTKLRELRRCKNLEVITEKIWVD